MHGSGRVGILYCTVRKDRVREIECSKYVGRPGFTTRVLDTTPHQHLLTEPRCGRIVFPCYLAFDAMRFPSFEFSNPGHLLPRARMWDHNIDVMHDHTTVLL